MKTILISGDSYTYGQGCRDRIYHYDKTIGDHIGKYFAYPKDPASEFCWASLLQKHLPDYNVVNLASPGNSQFGIFKDTVDYINTHDDIELVMVNATFFNRVSIATFGNPDMINPWSPTWHDLEDTQFQSKDYVAAKVGYVKYLMNNEILQYQSAMSTLGVHSVASSKNIKFLWSTPETNHNTHFEYPAYKSWMAIDHLRYTHVCRYDFSGCMDFQYNFDNYHFVDNHVNAAGHEMYFEKELFPTVKKVLNIT
jgi:hypothetical protein